MKRALLPTVLGACLLLSCGCGGGDGSGHGKSEPPAKVANPVTEQSLSTIVLTEKAEVRLGIVLAEVELADVQQKRTFGGETVVPPGQMAVVSAPIAGLLGPPGPLGVPLPGSQLEKGQAVFSFTPLLTPERDVLTPAERVSVAQTRAGIATAQIEAGRDVEAAKINVEAAQIAYDRAQELLRSKAGSQRSMDEAEAALRLAKEAQAAAEARHAFLSGIRLEEEAGELASHTIESPVAGVLQDIPVAAGETVVAGEALLSVVKLNPIWVRVPVYVGNWRQIDTEHGASVGEYGQPPDAPARAAKYVSAPPRSADPNATTVDLFYELDNEDGRLYPGQRLPVTLPIESRQKSLVVPFSAILYDIYGGAWVYRQEAPQTYVRTRVEVKYVDPPNAVLQRGLEPGAKVVTDGAVELFGTEFFVSK
jgi:cobalt-zinc-cadmium efflux system membrane fusion protein